MSSTKGKPQKITQIARLEDAIKILTARLDNAWSDELGSLMPVDSASKGKANFGLWFRGHTDASHGLCASVARGPVEYEEAGMFHHFRLKNAQHGANCETPFDWLSLMQHYYTPTRLLDWTESVLTALFFATSNEDADERDGALIVLNARRLNYRSSCLSRSDVAVPNSLDVVLRAALATERSIDDVIDYMKRPTVQQQIDDTIKDQKNVIEKIEARDSDVLLRLARPIAVLPKRQNPRMIAQSAAFTIEGGKSFLPNAYMSQEKKPPETVPLDQIPVGIKRLPIYSKFIIPSGSKKMIREQLRIVGVDASLLFPELEYQSDHVRRQWRWVYNPQDADEDGEA